MTTIEKLFVQIFERKKRIIEQVKHQTELFDQHLASKCFLDGIAPPSWLFSPSFPPFSSDPIELKKEELITGLLLQPTQPPNHYSSSHYSLYQNHFIPLDNEELLPTVSCSEVGASNNGTNAGDRLSVLPPFQIDDNIPSAFNCVPELDPSVTSPPKIDDNTLGAFNGVPDLGPSVTFTSPLDVNDTRTFDNCADRGRSVVGELDPSVRSPLDSGDPRMVDKCPAHGQSVVAELDPSVRSPLDCGNPRMFDECRAHGQSVVAEFDPSVMSPQDCGHARSLDNCADRDQSCDAELDPRVSSPPDCGDARMLDIWADHSQLLVKIQRSKSRQRALQLRNSAEASKSRLRNENKDVGVYTNRGIGSAINSLQYDHVNELELVKPSDTNTGDCGEEEVKLGEFGGKEKNSHLCNDRTNRSVNPIQQVSSLKVPGNDGNSSYIADEDGFKCLEDLTEQPNHFNETSKLVYRSVLDNANFVEEKANVVECRGNFFSDRITQSRSSVSQTNTSKEALEVGNSSTAEEHKESLDKMAENQLNFASELQELVKSSSVVSKESYGLRKGKAMDKQIKENGSNTYSGRITRSRSSRRQPNHLIKYMDQDNSCGNGKELKQLSAHVHDSIELVKPLNVACESSDLKEKIRDYQNIDARSDANYCRISSSSSINNVTPKVDNSGDAIFAESFGKSSQPPQLSSLVQRAKVDLQVLSHSQPNVLPCTESLILETNIDGDGLVKVPSVTSESNSDGARCAVGVLELRPPCDYAILVNPKQLDLDDAEKNSSVEACDPELENKQEDIDKQLSPLLHSRDVVQEITSVSYHEKPILSIEAPLSEEQEFSWNFCKDSSEGHMKGGAVLVGECTSNSVQQKMDSFISRSQQEDSYFLGSWPQHKRIKIGGEATNALSSSPSLKINPYQPMCKYHKRDSVQPDVANGPVEEMHGSLEHQKIEESEVSSSKLQVDEVEICLERMGRNSSAAFSLILEGAPSTSNLKRLAAGVSQGCLLEKAEMADPATSAEVMMQDNLGENQVRGENTPDENNVSFQLGDELELEDAVVQNNSDNAMQENQYHFERKCNLSNSPSASPLSQYVNDNDQNMPEFEGFVMGKEDELPCTASERINFDNLDLLPTELARASVLERLCKSTCLHTPLSHFSATYNLHEALNLYHSIPNGLLEGIELRNTLNVKGDGNKQLGADYSFLDEGINHAFHERSHSISLPLSNAQSAWDITKPCMSPIGKFWDCIPPKSGSSGKRVSSIPELPCIHEENETTDGVSDRLLEGFGPELEISSAKREPLADITKISKLTSVCDADMHDIRGSLASINTEVSFSGTCDRTKMKLRNKNSDKRRLTSKDKENQNISLGGDGIKRGNGSLHSRFSKPKLSGKASLRKGGSSLLETESKPNNIVSNITSFIPLVQQKQAAAVITGKRDIKVKALEAAEAAKRNAEKKENERKRRKEAMKLERVKMEERNLRQLELEKIKKQEEKMKKEAEMAAKKRQREEEERKEKERKKMRVEEAKRQHLAHDNKLKEEKEVKIRAPDEKAHERESKARLGKHEKIEKAKGDDILQTVPLTEPMTTKVPTTDKNYASVVSEDHKASSDYGDNLKVTDSIQKASKSESLISKITREQSYEISPYKGSDDEDEDEDDDIRNRKFFPSWASKNHVALVVSSQQRIDPESIFHPESFCNISEVLLPRRLQQK